MKVTMTKRKIPPIPLSKIYTDHYTFPLMEARAITTLCTGNLIYKNWAIWKFRMKNSGDLRCMFPPFQEPDTMLHVLECDFYTTKFEEKDGPAPDQANYLVKLDKERMDKFNKTLISCEGWSSKEQKH